MRRESGFQGREPDLEILGGLLERGVGVVLLAGAAGMGKTRLLREFADRAVSASAVMWASAESVSGPEPFGVLLDLLESLPPAAITRDVEELKTMLYEGAILAVSPRQVAARLRGILPASTRVVTVFEDIQWADELSHGVLAHLARSASQDGITYIWSFRSDEALSASLVRLLEAVSGQAQRIELGPLSEDLIMDLASELNPSLGADQLKALAYRAEGVPLFAQELAVATIGPAIEIPLSLSLAAEKRLDVLDRKHRRVIETASLFPVRIEVSMLAEASEVSISEAVRALRAAVDVGLLTDREGRTTFRHALIKESISDSIMAAERQVIHRRIGQVLEDYARDGGSVAPAVLARQLWQAGEEDRARPFALLAGKAALKTGALDEARSHFERVIDSRSSLSELCDAELGLSEVLNRVGDVEGATVRLRRCASLLDSLGDQEAMGEALVRLASVHAVFDPGTAIEVLDEVLGMFKDDQSSEAYARAIVTKGYILTRFLEEPTTGKRFLVQGLDLARRVGSIEAEATVHDGLAWAFEEDGDIAESERHGRAACDLALAAGNHGLVARTLGGQASHLGLHGKVAESLALLDVAKDRIGVEAVHLLQALDHLKAWILWLAGRPAEADHLAALLETSRFSRIYGRVIRVWAALEREDERQARSILDAWWAELGGAPTRNEALQNIASLEAERAQLALCEIIIGVARPPADPLAVKWAAAYDEVCRRGRPDSAGLGAALHARGLIHLERLYEAAEVLHIFDDDPRMMQYPFRWAAALELRGLIDVGLGRQEEALIKFMDASSILEQVENGCDRARCLRLAAELTNPDDAKNLLLVARRVAAESAASGEQNRIERSLRSRGMRPRAGRPRGSGVGAGDISPREKEVVVVLASGASNADIAARLFISNKTVENHVARAQKRLGLSNRAGLAAWAAKNGYV